MQYLSTDLLCRIVLEKDDATAVLKWASQYVLHSVPCSIVVGLAMCATHGYIVTTLMFCLCGVH
jgi:predicted restriction endonuclease